MTGKRNCCIAVKGAASVAPRVTRGAAVRRAWPLVMRARSTARTRSHDEDFTMADPGALSRRGRRVPYQNRPPWTVGAVDLLRVTASADESLELHALHRHLADVMRPRPPAVDIVGEHAERFLDARTHGDALADWGKWVGVRYSG